MRHVSADDQETLISAFRNAKAKNSEWWDEVPELPDPVRLRGRIMPFYMKRGLNWVRRIWDCTDAVPDDLRHLACEWLLFVSAEYEATVHTLTPGITYAKLSRWLGKALNDRWRQTFRSFHRLKESLWWSRESQAEWWRFFSDVSEAERVLIDLRTSDDSLPASLHEHAARWVVSRQPEAGRQTLLDELVGNGEVDAYDDMAPLVKRMLKALKDV